jgi:hypothetical protein
VRQIVAADQFASGLLPVIDAVPRTGATRSKRSPGRSMTAAFGPREVRAGASSVANLLSRANKLAEAL